MFETVAVPARLTQRHALAMARSAYEATYTRLKMSEDVRRARLSGIAYQEGVAAFALLERRATDVQLGEDARLALAYFITSASSDDPASALAWLEQLPFSVGRLMESAQLALPGLMIEGIAHYGAMWQERETTWRLAGGLGVSRRREATAA